MSIRLMRYFKTQAVQERQTPRRLCTVDLSNGTATLVSAVGLGQTGLNSLAVTPTVVVPEAGTLQLALGALTLVGAVVRGRK